MGPPLLRLGCFILGVCGILVSNDVAVVAFSVPTRNAARTGRATSTTSLSDSIADALFETIAGSLPGFRKEENKQGQPSPLPPLPPPPFLPTPEGLIQRAKLLLACDLGVQDESLLDSKFKWIGPNLGSSVLGKTDYLAAGKFFDLRSVFPDLDYRAHDFRIDENDPMTVRLTTRTAGTMRGELRLRNEVIPPNGKQMRCPPEAISMTFDERTGRLVKLCSGFTMDRLVGNTGGLCGVMGAATVAGSPPSDWEVYPVPQVIGRFFGRPTQQLDELTLFLAPFPETVMIQLAKGIFSADMAAADSDLLAPSFSYYGAYDGPVDKSTYIEKYASQIFDGLEPQLSYFRVDPYDPYRVWVDVKPTGTTASGVYVDGPPQAFSFTFDDDGFCIRLTASAVMDPSIGNTGGLSGVEGETYVAGTASLAIVARPLPQALQRVRKRLLAPITKIDVDDYSLEPDTESIALPSIAPTPPLSPVRKLEIMEKEKMLPETKRPTIPLPTMPAVVGKAKAPEVPGEMSTKRPTLTLPNISMPSVPTPNTADFVDTERKAKAAAAAAEKRKTEEVSQKARADALEAKKRRAEEVEEAKRVRAAEQEEEEMRRAKQAEEAKRRRAEKMESEKARKAQEAEEARRIRAAELDAERKRRAQIASEQAAAERRLAQEAEGAKIAREEAIAAERQRKAKEAEAAKRKAEREEEKREKAVAAMKAREAAVETQKQKQAQIEAVREQERKRKEEQEAEAAKTRARIAAEREAEARRKELAAEQARAAAAETRKQQQAQKAAEKEAEKQMKAEAVKQRMAQKAAERKRRAEEAKRAREAERQRVAKLSAEKEAAKLTSKQAPAPSPRPSISLLGFRGVPGDEERSPKPAPTTKTVAPQPTSTPTPSPRRTFSLAALFGDSSEEEDAGPKSRPSQSIPQPKKLSSAPRGIPVISDWKQNRDGSITGRISGTDAFGEGEKVTTSKVGGKAVGGTIVQTTSGSKYFLEDARASSRREMEKIVASKRSSNAREPSARSTIALFGRGSSPTPAPGPRASKQVPKPRPSQRVPSSPAQSPRPSISLLGFGGSAQAPAVPRASKQIPKPRPSQRVTRSPPAQSPRPSISLLGLGGGSTPPAAAPRPSKQVPKPRPSLRVPKSQPAQPAQSPRPSISLLGFGGASPAPSPRASKQVPKPRPSKRVTQEPSFPSPAPSSRRTISLFGFGSGNDSIGSSSVSKSVPVPKSSKIKAPRGVPTLNKWKNNRDGSITGRITGSNQFEKNEKVTTSPIASGDLTTGSVVKTKSGSRYFLA